MGWFSSMRIPSVEAEEARQLLAEGATLLDVREKAEWNAGHAPAAKHLPLGRIQEAGSRVPAKGTVVVVCRSGNRSRQATMALREQGINAVNLAGGMNSWARSGGSVVDRGNRPGRVI